MSLRATCARANSSLGAVDAAIDGAVDAAVDGSVDGSVDGEAAVD